MSEICGTCKKCVEKAVSNGCEPACIAYGAHGGDIMESWHHNRMWDSTSPECWLLYMKLLDVLDNPNTLAYMEKLKSEVKVC